MRGSCTRKNSQRGVKSVSANSKFDVSRGSTFPQGTQPVIGLEIAAVLPNALDTMRSVFSRRWSNESPSPKTLA